MTTPLRSDLIASLTGERFDVLVIGGGITGAGVSRDAAMRGLRVALVEQNDFASGTSSRSSRLVHGGIRYLEHGQFRLVFESSRERRILLRIAPHLVRPLQFVWPVYEGARVSRWKLALALTLYDVLSLFRNVRRHERLAARATLALEPLLRPSRLTGGARYWDAATDDSRLTLSTVLSARENGAVAGNHVRVIELLREGDRVIGARVVDSETDATFDVSARVVVNATGPWSDRIEALIGPTRVAGVRGSKGIHIAVHRSRIGNGAALTLIAPQDGRVMFALPAGSFTIIGTTDTYDDVSPDDVCPSAKDVAYLLAAANHYFPEAMLSEADVVSAWAGLRPLAAPDPNASDPGSASREHAITETSPGFLRVTGGKLTTYRSMSEAVVDTIERLLGQSAGTCRTAEVPLHGGDVSDIARAIEHATQKVSDGAVAERLVRAYGSRWEEVWSLVEADASLGARITPERHYLVAELRHAVERELARTLGDLLIRRVPVAFETNDHGRAAARSVAPIVAGWLGWDAQRTAAAVDAYDAEVSRMFTIAERVD